MNCVFLNGMGKSGNHILYRFRNLIFPNGFLRILARHHHWKEEICNKHLSKDLCFVIGHYPWNHINEIYLRVRGCQMIFIVRDLRDVIAAFYRAAVTKNKTVIIIPAKECSKRPFVLEKGARICDLAKNIHSDFSSKFSFAKVWSERLVFSPQRVGLTFSLEDGDVVEIHMK